MNTLSEHESKVMLSNLGIHFPREILAYSADEAFAASEELGYPVVAKVGAETLAHKSEAGFVALNLRSGGEVRTTVSDLLARSQALGPDRHILIAPMVQGIRELILGYKVDELWGPLVVLGLGGVLAEIAKTAVMLPAPVRRSDAVECLERFDSSGILGEVRGDRAANREALIDLLVAVGALADHPNVWAAEMNPVIISDGMPIPVDALVELRTPTPSETLQATKSAPRFQPRPEHWQALLNPRAIAVTGVSDHPGKFGSVAFHNILVGGYEGSLYPINRSKKLCFGYETLPSIDELPNKEIDSIVICTPAETVSDSIRSAAGKGIRSAIICSAGFSEIGEEGAALERELERIATECDVLLIGPNVQGVVSTQAHLVAQIVGPSPSVGNISVVSQSGNISSTVQNLATEADHGIARALSLGNSAQTGVLETLEFLSTDPATEAIVLYLESFGAPSSLRDRLAAISRAKPVVCIKGGRTSAGGAAAATHTGALAGDAAVFSAMARACGMTMANDPETAIDIAASLSAYRQLRGPRTAVLTTVGGWGVLTVDAIEESSLKCAELAESTLQALNGILPARWSRRNPIDLAGGETTDSVVDALEILGNADEVDAVVLFGVGIQSNEAHLMKAGQSAGLPNLERMIAFHERQDFRYVRTANRITTEKNTPVLIASELGQTLLESPAFAELRALRMPCFRTGIRAVRALDAVWQRSRFLTQ